MAAALMAIAASETIMETRSDVREELLTHQDGAVCRLARKTMMTAGVRSLLDLKSADLSQELIRRYATHPRREFRMALAGRADLDWSILRMLMFDVERDVSAAALRSPSLSDEIRVSLGSDEYRRVWPLVLKYLRPIPEPVLHAMLLAEPAMAALPKMPDCVVLKVLEDDAVPIEIKSQILATRPTLTNCMWAWIVQRTEQEVALAALGREDLPSAYQRVLVSRLSDGLLVHLANQAPSPPGLIDEMGRRQDWQLRLVAAAHPHVSDDALSRLVWDKDSRVREAVTTRLLKNAEPHLRAARREWIRRLRSGLDSQP